MSSISLLCNDHEVKDAFNLEWSSHYGEDGGGFGYLRFSLPRQVTNTRYPDVGFGYEVLLMKGPATVLFHGQIRQIEEASSRDGDVINVTALGWPIVAGDDELLRAYCDTRLSKWQANGEVPSGDYRPDQFATGANALGLYMNATTQEVLAAARTEFIYEFYPGEVASRIKCNLSMVLGTGVLFDGTADSIDAGNSYVYYTNDSGESRVTAGMVLWNTTQNVSVSITAIDTGLNRFTVDGAISSWISPDELVVYGPLFQAQIADITGDTITYTNDIGEGNVAATNMLVNLTQKAVAEVSSIDTGLDEIVVTDATHLQGWRLNDTILVGASLFFAVIDSVSTATITYSSPIGERVVSSTTGWVLHNLDRNETASVASWNAASNQLDVTDSTHISAWVATELIFIYTPYAFEIRDDNDVRIWPPSNVRDGAIYQNRTAIDVTTTGSPTAFILRFYAFIAGAGNESSFAQISNLRVYSTTEDITADFIAKEAIAALSATGHDLSSSETEVETIGKIIEPMIYEFKTWREALSEACKFGDSSLNPLAWGIRPDRNKTFYLETQPDHTSIAYILKRQTGVEITASADIQESTQKVRAQYTDVLGEQQVTAYVEDTNAHFNGHFRATTIRLDNVYTDADATLAAQKYLAENKAAVLSSSYQIEPSSLFSFSKIPAAWDEIVADGRYLLIEDFRAVHAGQLGVDIGSTWTLEQIVGVEINYDERQINIIPGSARKTFEKYMAELARLAQR